VSTKLQDAIKRENRRKLRRRDPESKDGFWLVELLKIAALLLFLQYGFL